MLRSETCSRWTPMLSVAVVCVAGTSMMLALWRTGPHEGRTPPSREVPWTPSSAADRLGNDKWLRETAAAALDRFAEARPHKLIDLLHLWRVQSAKDRWSENADLRKSMGILFSSDLFHRTFPDAPSLVYRGPTGWCVRLRTGDPRKEHWQTQYHVDQALAVCAEAGVPIDTPLSVGNQSCSIAELLDSSRLAYVAGQECEWSLVAYCSYLPDDHQWVNRFGETWSYERIVGTLIARDPGFGSCAGTHKQYALAYALRLDQENSFLSDPARAQIEDYLRSCSAALMRTQLPSGAWDSRWADAAPDGSGQLFAGAPVDELLLVTSHHLEWLFIAPDELRPADGSLTAALEFVARAALQYSPEESLAQYCALSHTARCLSLATALDVNTTQKQNRGD